MTKRRLVILGSTGSVGRQALEVAAYHPELFEVLGLSAGSNSALLSEQAAAFRPRFVAVSDEGCAKDLQHTLPKGTSLEVGKHASSALAALPEADLVLHGIRGLEGLAPLISALKAGKVVALANKESIVCANVLIKKLIKESLAKILPVDSEMSAIFQCLQNGKETEVTSLILTASGGPFLKMKQEDLASVTPLQALKHPIWSMGAKISIDSATMFNKGLELIEASNLFNMQSNHISVLIHPQSIVHSMVEYIDGSVIAQLAVPDMRLAIQYALGYPNRLKRQVARLSLAELGSLTFYDAEAVPAIRLARRALNEGGVQPIVYNAANDIGVELFMQERIGFLDICKIVEDAMDNTPKGAANTLEEIMFIDTQVRRQVLDRVCKLI